MSRLIKQENFSYLYLSNRKRYRDRSDKELVVVELINRWCCCLQVGNRGNILLGYHDYGCSTNNKAFFSLYIQYRSYVRRPVHLIPTCKELPKKETFLYLNRVKTFFSNSMTQERLSALACVSIEKGILKKYRVIPHGMMD